jgi:hypothetical protein
MSEPMNWEQRYRLRYRLISPSTTLRGVLATTMFYVAMENNRGPEGTALGEKRTVNGPGDNSPIHRASFAQRYRSRYRWALSSTPVVRRVRQDHDGNVAMDTIAALKRPRWAKKGPSTVLFTQPDSSGFFRLAVPFTVPVGVIIHPGRAACSPGS